MNVRGMMTNVRVRCDDPLPQRPSDRALLLQLSTQLQRFFNKTSLSGRPWAIDELTLVTTSGTEDYTLAATSQFGKAIQVRTVYPANPGHIERDVDFYDLGDVNLNWPYPKNFGGGFSFDGSPNTAARIGFFRRAGTDQVYARVNPIPQTSAQYQILYQVGLYGETVPLDETPMLPEHHALIEIRTAIALLPHCQWSDDKKDNAAKREELARTLVADSRDLEHDFIAYIAGMSAGTRPTYRDLPFSID